MCQTRTFRSASNAAFNLARSSYDHVGVGESEEDLVLKRHLDRLYTDFPFFGSRKMVVGLAKLGFRVCRKRVRRLMREMGIWAIYPKPRLSENRESRNPSADCRDFCWQRWQLP